MELQIKTLTPLWTGGAEPGKVDRIHETGILGSLRWWYEALVRGLGGKGCDPSQGGCRLDVEEYGKSRCLSDAGLCDVCQVFGATGWKRRFRLVITDQTQQDTSSPKRISARRPVNLKTKNVPTWYFSDYPRTGNLSIQIQSRDSKFPPAVIGGLIQFMADWAGIGAKTQMGFGVIELQNGGTETKTLYKWLDDVAAESCNYYDLPSLQNIFFARIQLKNATDQDTFNAKYDLRRLFLNDKYLRHFIMGTVKGQRSAAKIKVSRPYGDGLIRVWGWIPETANEYRRGWNRDKVVKAIYNELKNDYTILVWREMNSDRDTVEPSNCDAKKFLQSLLGLREEIS